MTVYTLLYNNVAKDLVVHTHADAASAKTYIDAATNYAAGNVVIDAGSLAREFTGSSLAALYRALAVEGTPEIPAVFTNKGSGAKRVFELLESRFSRQPYEEAAPHAEQPAANAEGSEASENMEADMAKKAKVKKAKAVKVPRVKKEKAPKKARSYQADVVSKGSEKRKEAALELISRARGATAAEIAEKLELSLGTAKNLVWYLRRDGKKITVDKTSERRPYIIA